MTRAAHRACRMLVMLAFVAAVASEGGAQVVQLQGGGSTLTEGIGGALSMWTGRFEGGVGLGYLDGVRISVFAKGALNRTDTLRLGNDVIPVRFPTDLFGGSNALLVQGASFKRSTTTTRVLAFGGASARALASPAFVTAMRGDRALGIVQVEHDLSASTTLDLHAIFSDRQTMLQGIRWRRPSGGLELGAIGGVGANEPYLAGSVEWRQPRLDVRASWVEQGEHFRRAGIPMPSQAEPDRENVLLSYRAREHFVIGVGRQHFRQDSIIPGTPERATLNQLFTNGELLGARVGAGLFDSESGDVHNFSGYLNASRDVTEWLQTELYVLRVQAPRESRTTTPIVRFREFLGPRLTLLQVVSFTPGHTSVAFGGSFTSGLVALGLDYQVVHTPFRPADPFVQSVAVNARLQLGGYQLHVSSFVTPDGRVRYSASGTTYLYFGNASGGNGRPPRVRFERYLVTGRVVDESGRPVEGAAIELGDDLVFSNSSGVFFVRVGDDEDRTVRVVPAEFLVPVQYDVVRAPIIVKPARQDAAQPITIVVRRAAVSG